VLLLRQLASLNGLLRTECEDLFFLGYECVASAVTFCVIFLILVGATTLVIFILFVVVVFFTDNRLALLVPFCIGYGCSLSLGGRTISPSLWSEIKLGKVNLSLP
jgi:hypothetical protein